MVVVCSNIIRPGRLIASNRPAGRRNNLASEPPAEHLSAGAHTSRPRRAQAVSRPPKAPAQRVEAQRRAFTLPSTALSEPTAPARIHASGCLREELEACDPTATPFLCLINSPRRAPRSPRRDRPDERDEPGAHSRQRNPSVAPGFGNLGRSRGRTRDLSRGPTSV